MKATLNFSFGQVKMSSRLVDGDYQISEDESRYNHHYRFMVRISYDGKCRYFSYWTSYNDWRNAKEELDESDYKNALNCIFWDSYAAQNTFEDFCSEFGYSDDSIKALKTYKECKRNAERLNKLFSGLDLLSVQNELEEMM